MSKKLTMKEIKELLYDINKDIIILDTIYHGNKIKMNCECLICNNKFPKSWNDLLAKQGCPACGKNRIKITKQQIRDHVKQFGYEVVQFTKDDSNKGTMFIIKCPGNHEYETSYREFNREELKRSGSCRKCNQNNIGSARRKNIEEVMNNIINWGYAVEDGFTYKNSRETHTFTCQHGHIREINYSCLERTPECPECKGNYLFLTEDKIRKMLTEMGLEYIDGFTETKFPFRYRCECGKIDTKRLYRLRDGSRCPECSNRRYRTYEEVRKIYEDFGCVLLEESFNKITDKLKFRCKCGNPYEKDFASFIASPQCYECGLKNRSGENSHLWNPNLTNEDRIRNRKYPEYEEWRIFVYDRDNYTCQCCGDDTGHNLNAHHLDSHNWAIDKRIDVDNGITLCKDCHTDFHHEHGYGDNTREQFEEFMINKNYTNKQPTNITI